MAVTLIALCLIVCFLIFWWYLKFLYYNKYLKKYSGPFPLPVIGNAHNFGDVSDLIPILQNFTNKYGSVFKIMLGYMPRLIIADQKTAAFLLSSTSILKKSYEYKYFHSWLGNGLLVTSGKRWKKQRKLITPAFHFRILEQFVEVFRNGTSILIQKMREEIGQEPVDIMPYIKLCALDIICESAMGTAVNAQHDPESEYVQSIKEMGRIIIERTISLTKMWNVLFTFSRDYHKQKKALRVIHGYTDSLIKKRRQKLIDENNDPISESPSKQKLAFLDLLLQSTVDGEPLSDEIIREEVDTFMFGGHDTTTSAISFTLYCLSQHPTIQERVVEELKNILSSSKSRPLTYDDLQNMKYLDMVIKESMRLYPPIPIYGRLLEEDVVFDDEILPKGLALTVFAYGLHRNPDHFPNPEKFDPQRFSSDNVNRNLTYAYVPFSAGPRNCLGQRFANIEMKYIISEIMRNFELLPVEDHTVTLRAETTLKPGNGLPIYIKKRNF